MDEPTAIARLKSGDICALEWLVTRYQLKAIHTAYLITFDAQQAEDIVQEEFLRAFQHIKRFDTGKPFEPWFLRCVIHSAYKRAQRSNREVRLGDEKEEVDLEQMLALPDISPEQEVEAAEDQAHLQSLIAQLSPRQRAVVAQRYYLEMSEDEMAERLGIAHGTVKWLLHQAREKLRALLLSERKLL
ncbi:MAG: sigma-70 family RNA polymerase sigma factor [Anaerolineaceae bacterium]|nr:sigma-70 family RNA polymerase sigma factor [Anaerolineaceae bacterium]